MPARKGNELASWEVDAHSPHPVGETRVRRSYCSKELVLREYESTPSIQCKSDTASSTSVCSPHCPSPMSTNCRLLHGWMSHLTDGQLLLCCPRFVPHRQVPMPHIRLGTRTAGGVDSGEWTCACACAEISCSAFGYREGWTPQGGH